MPTAVDVVVVAYRSASQLRGCVEPLCADPALAVVVVDNACPERSFETVADLALTIEHSDRNAGFAGGCNAGAARGSAPAILFLNPDARISAEDVHRLARLLDADGRIGAAGPEICEPDGRPHAGPRRVPRLRSAFGEALFLHHLLPSQWTTELVRDPVTAQPEWLSGAVLCVRRSAFEAIGGFDARFFLYSEDTDIGARLRRRGFRLVFDPTVRAVHIGGASASGPNEASMLRGRLTYARIHERGLRYVAFRVAYVLHELLRLPLAARRSRTELRGRVAALQVAATAGVRPVPGAARRTSSTAG